MTIGNAKAFIARARDDNELRLRINAAKNVTELNGVLDDVGLMFSPGEFDEAYHNRLTECQFEEDADEIKEFKLWWDLVSQSLSLTPFSSPCAGGCCSP